MRLSLSAPPNQPITGHVQITGSKSESNRLLLLQALYPQISISNLSNADDVVVMQKGLEKQKGEVDIHHAGTAMRFLTAYFASREGAEVKLTGSHRMKERPIGILVDALRSLGADIHYLENEGYPPLEIRGRSFPSNKVQLPADISSQYISALLLIAPSLEEGLEVELKGKITSLPYIKMTLSLLQEVGVRTNFSGQTIKVYPARALEAAKIVVESDWSSASYYYSIIALSPVGSEISLTAYRQKSLQGDSVLQELYAPFGVTTSFDKHKMTLRKTGEPVITHFEQDLTEAPDLAQTLAVSCFGLGVSCTLTGLHTLKIKETDRLEALKEELGKLGADIAVTVDSLSLQVRTQLHSGVSIDTYHDHRMAMAFAPLAMCTSLIINDAGVVTKSYPDFWSDLKTLSFDIQELD